MNECNSSVLRHSTDRTIVRRVAPGRSELTISCVLMLIGCCAGEGLADVARFKAFIESPPANITKLVYKVRASGDSNTLALAYDPNRKAYVYSEELAKSRGPLQLGLDDHGFRWYAARWQENAFLVRAIDPAPDGSTLTNNPRFFRSGGRYESNYWALFGTTLQTWTAAGPLPESANSPYKRPKTSSAHVAALVASESLRQILSLGIKSVNPGTIRWDGDRFSVPSADIDGITIRGALISEGEQVSRLELHYNEFPYVIEYGYSRELTLSYLPNTFVLFFVGDSQRQLIHEFEILTIETGQNLLSADHFQPVPKEGVILLEGTNYFLHAGVQRELVYTNRSGPLRVGAHGALVRLPKPVRADTHPTSARRGRVILVLCMMVGVPIAVIWFWKRTEHQPKGTK